jgi:hypothetical protein
MPRRYSDKSFSTSVIIVNIATILHARRSAYPAIRQLVKKCHCVWGLYLHVIKM